MTDEELADELIERLKNFSPAMHREAARVMDDLLGG